MKYFVTGATGFIGSKLVKQLRERGHEVLALVRDPARAQPLGQAGVQLLQGDVLDKELMRAGMSGVDGLFHVAGWYKIGQSAEETAAGVRVNVEGTRNVLELMRELAIPKGVYTSTLAVNSNTQGKLVDESYRYDGPHLSAYDESKWRAHHEIAEPMIREGLPLVIVMPGVVYGPGDPSGYGESLRAYLRGQMPFLPGDLTTAPAYVDDVALAHILAMEKGQPGESYMICGAPCNFVDQFKLAEQITGIPAPRLHIPPAVGKVSAAITRLVEQIAPLPSLYSSENQRSITGVSYIGDNSKARRELGYAPRSLEDGLRETLDYELRDLEIQPPQPVG